MGMLDLAANLLCFPITHPIAIHLKYTLSWVVTRSVVSVIGNDGG